MRWNLSLPAGRRLTHFVTHRFKLEQAKEAFDLVADYRDGVVKAMITL